MVLYGPFKFPSNTSPNSPILMVCPDKDVTLLKCIKITLPHNIHQASRYSRDSLGIQVIKASHASQADGVYVFEDMDAEQTEVSFKARGMKQYAVFFVSHFCFLSLRSDPRNRAARTRICCICPMYPTGNKASCTYHLPIIYYLDPWIEVSIKSMVVFLS